MIYGATAMPQLQQVNSISDSEAYLQSGVWRDSQYQRNKGHDLF